MLGNEVKVGDTVAYATRGSGSGLAYMTTAVVLESSDRYLKVDRLEGSGIKGGLTNKWVWDATNKTGEHITVKAPPVRITTPRCCIILKSA